MQIAEFSLATFMVQKPECSSILPKFIAYQILNKSSQISMESLAVSILSTTGSVILFFFASQYLPMNVYWVSRHILNSQWLRQLSSVLFAFREHSGVTQQNCDSCARIAGSSAVCCSAENFISSRYFAICTAFISHTTSLWASNRIALVQMNTGLVRRYLFYFQHTKVNIRLCFKFSLVPSQLVIFSQSQFGERKWAY